MRGAGELEPAADHRAVQHRHDRNPAELDARERLVPHPRVQYALGSGPLAELGEIEPGAEVVAGAVQHDGAHALGRRGEEIAEPLDGGIVQRVALGGAVEAEEADRVLALEVQRRSGTGLHRRILLR